MKMMMLLLLPSSPPQYRCNGTIVIVMPLPSPFRHRPSTSSVVGGMLMLNSVECCEVAGIFGGSNEKGGKAQKCGGKGWKLL